MEKRKWTLYLGQVRGTALYIHWSFWILVVLVFLSSYQQEHSWSQAILGVLFIFALFACITLHEFGHIVVASRYGCPARSITLYPIGGMARMDKLPEKPLQELWMALAGPWVNVVIAAFLFLAISIWQGVPTIEKLPPLTQHTFLYNLMMYNLILAAFNLIPAFPMDGGRVLRALLATRLSRVRATVIAARIGQVVSGLFILAGFFFSGMLVLIGIFLFFVAGEEMLLEITRSTLLEYKIKDALMHRFTRLVPGEKLGSAIRLMLDVQETEFVVTENEDVYGLVSSEELIRALQERGPETLVSDIMRRQVVMLDAEQSLADAFQRMITSGQRIYPVLQNGKLAGILDLAHINEFSQVREVSRLQAGAMA